ncbi:ectonucleoside triphosphate diphosphohydrolase 1 isoform X2 [Tiliqua scincoides]
MHCMNKAKTSVPSREHRNTPVYLGATAGMRLLSLQNEDTSKKVLSAVQSTLRSYPFSYKGARILSGQEEGAYGWITINYLLGNFKKSLWPSFLPPLFSNPGTTGALDLGGASTQITFVPDTTVESQGDALNFRLYGKNYTVYTHSFLCYGKDQALNLKLAIDAQGASKGFHIEPCYHRGYVKILNISDLLTNPCTAPSLQPPPSNMQLRIDGAGNYGRCLTSIQKIFNMSQCPYSNCAFNGIFMPPLTGNFGAFSAFYYVMDFLNVTNEPLEDVIMTLKSFCSRPWDKVKEEFPNIKEKYLSDYCFSGTYIVALLNERYSFKNEEWQRIHFLKKIAKSDAGWTLGYMLNLTNMIPAEPSYVGPLSQAAFVSLITICTILAVCLLLTGFLIYYKPKCLHKGII